MSGRGAAVAAGMVGGRLRPSPPPVYAIADADALAPRPLPAVAASMAEAGIRWIQLRAKRATTPGSTTWSRRPSAPWRGATPRSGWTIGPTSPPCFRSPASTWGSVTCRPRALAGGG